MKRQLRAVIYHREERIKLAFVCWLTAVGVPMVFAGNEFADEHDLIVSNAQKERNPVNRADKRCT